MKALIVNGRVAELHETGFPVAEPFFWADVVGEVVAGWSYSDGVFTPPVQLDPQPITTVSRLQGILALDDAGLLDDVEAVVNDPGTPRQIKLAWENALTFERNSQALAYLAQEAEISEQQLDDLFVAASQIQA